MVKYFTQIILFLSVTNNYTLSQLDPLPEPRTHFTPVCGGVETFQEIN